MFLHVVVVAMIPLRQIYFYGNNSTKKNRNAMANNVCKVNSASYVKSCSREILRKQMDLFVQVTDLDALAQNLNCLYFLVVCNQANV